MLIIMAGWTYRFPGVQYFPFNSAHNKESIFSQTCTCHANRAPSISYEGLVFLSW